MCVLSGLGSTFFTGVRVTIMTKQLRRLVKYGDLPEGKRRKLLPDTPPPKVTIEADSMEVPSKRTRPRCTDRNENWLIKHKDALKPLEPDTEETCEALAFDFDYKACFIKNLANKEARRSWKVQRYNAEREAKRLAARSTVDRTIVLHYQDLFSS